MTVLIPKWSDFLMFNSIICSLLSEFNPVQQPQLNEKVLKDKRKKLRETFERILRLYEKENPDIYKELRKLEVEYEQKRAQLSQYFDAVKVLKFLLRETKMLDLFLKIVSGEIDHVESLGNFLSDETYTREINPSANIIIAKN